MESNSKPKKFFNWRESSRTNWGSTLSDANEMPDQYIKTGALLRIADAAEAMARNHNELIRELELYKGYYKSALKSNARLIKQISAYKGHLRKAKSENNKDKFYIHKPTGKIGKFLYKRLSDNHVDTILIFIQLQDGSQFWDKQKQFKKL